MADPNGTSTPTDRPATNEPAADSKGKGKAVDPNQESHAMEMEEDSSSEESGNEEPELEEEVEEEDEDNMEEIDTDNIVSGRTRGKRIDYVEAERMAKEAGEEVNDDEDDEDDDFEERDDPMEE